MPITIDKDATATVAASNPLANYPNLVVLNLGRPALDYWPIAMRNLIQWTACRLDGNHRTATLLRAVADHFYPSSDDQALWIFEDLEERGIDVDFDFEEADPPAVDHRLLGLVEGWAVCVDTCLEPRWEGQSISPVLDRNAENYLDFEFPIGAYEAYGIRGIRVYCVDLIHWIRSTIDLEEMAYQDEDAWLDGLECSIARRTVNSRYRSDEKSRATYGDHAVDGLRLDPASAREAGPKQQDSILEEVARFI